MKKFISILLSLIMIMGSVNVVLAESTVANPAPEWVCLRGYNSNQSGIAISNAEYVGNKYVSFIRFDLTEFLPQIYLCDDIKFSIKSLTYGSAGTRAPFDLSIVPDELEGYDNNTILYSNAGDLLKDYPAFYHCDEVLYYNSTHTIDIKSTIVQAIESGKNSIVAIRLSTTSTGRADFDPNSIALNINYNTEAVTSDAYYDFITSQFDFDTEAGVSSDAITENFTLPSFYKGSNITWASDNDAISITGNNAVVTRQLEDINVKLTATFSYKDGSSFDKDYTVTVAKRHILDVITEQFNSSYALTSEPLSAVTTDVNLASSYNGANLSWKSSNNNVVHPITGKVVPSADADTSVTLTPTISFDGDSRELNPINITVKKYEGEVKTLAPSQLANILHSNGHKADQDDSTLYIKSGSYTTAGVLWNRYAAYIMFDISDVKETIANSQGSMHINLTGQRWYSNEVRSDGECFNLYIINNNSWDNTLTCQQAEESGMTAYCDIAVDNCSDPNAVYCSPKGQTQLDQKYTTTDILPAVKAYLENNPDAEKITFMLFTPNNGAMLRFYGTNGTADQNPSLEIRYNFETPVIEAVKNTDNSYSAVIKTNDALSEGYNVYFAAYTSDNTLVGIDVKPVTSFEAGATKLTANTEKFTTQGATKIKCIITKADGITPLWKNDELKLG